MIVSPDNFFRPELDQSNYMVRLDENEPTGSVVLMFTMSDADRFGPASQIGQIFILGSDAQFFNASATGLNSGVILSK